MGIRATERPGVFSRYEVISSMYGEGAQGCCGLVAVASGGPEGVVVACDTLAQVKEAFGEDENDAVMVTAAELLFKNGAGRVLAVHPGDTPGVEEYAQTFSLLGEQGGIDAIVCDSHEPEVALALRDGVHEASGQGRERIGVVAGDETTALQLNSERICVVAPAAAVDGQAHGVFTAAAVAGRIVSAADKAANMAGVPLAGLDGIPGPLSEQAINELLSQGVSVAEPVTGGIELVRGVSSRTRTGEEPDYSYRSIMTAVTIDTVLRAVRNKLKGLLLPGRGGAATLGAIQSQAAVALLTQREAGLIASFAVPVVRRSDEDPTVCMVGLSFEVAVGLNQIHISADITI